MRCHTAEYSPCSEVTAIELVRQCQRLGLAGAVLTDHHFVWPEAELARLRREAGVPAHFLLCSGQEVSTVDLGDLLVYGAEQTFPRGVTLREVREQAPDAALVWAHPFRWRRVPVLGDLLHPALDGIEVLNGNQTPDENELAVQFWQRYGFRALAGSDVHELAAVGRFPSQCTREVKTVAELVTAIRNGECLPRTIDLPLAGG